MVHDLGLMQRVQVLIVVYCLVVGLLFVGAPPSSKRSRDALCVTATSCASSSTRTTARNLSTTPDNVKSALTPRYAIHTES